MQRFLRYVRIDTQSRLGSDTYPSTAKQLDLSRLLVEELREAGLADVELDEHGYVFATLPGVEGAPVVSLLAHVDTAPDAPGANVNPQVHEDYDGRELLPALSPATSSLLGGRLGHTIVTTDGTTLLGADNKAGVAEIMAAVAYLAAHPEIEHAPVRVCFTVDEEVGRGVEHLDLAKLGAEFAYTFDGERVGEIENETWSALELKVTFHGVPVHPGLAKDKLVNPVKLAAAFVASLPADIAPEMTEGRVGFIHPQYVVGDPTSATVSVYARDFEWDGLMEKERLIRELAERVSPTVTYERWEQYRNMRDYLAEVPHVVDGAMEAARRVGLEPSLASIRGGTDGSRLTEMGLPTPNVYTGGNEFHSVNEWISAQDMGIAAATAVELVKLWAEPEWAARARP
ncbi:MAG: peptidase T [Actinobacteria bacterium]|nr:peptidase T [Actinomycetota bacterium]